MVGGYPYKEGRQTDIIDMEDPSFDCGKENLFPIDILNPVGGLIGQTPMVCGGITSGNPALVKACYTFHENGGWKEDQTATMNYRRNGAEIGSVIIDNKLIVAGGSNYSSERAMQSSIELVSPNTKATILPMEIEDGIQDGCVVRWDTNTFMIIGGNICYGNKWERFGKDTFFVHMDNNTVTKGPQLIDGRRNFACNEIIVNGEPFIVAAGGYTSKNDYTLVEMLSIPNYVDGWKKGQNFKSIIGKIGQL